MFPDEYSGTIDLHFADSWKHKQYKTQEGHKSFHVFIKEKKDNCFSFNSENSVAFMLFDEFHSLLFSSRKYFWKHILFYKICFKCVYAYVCVAFGK